MCFLLQECVEKYEHRIHAFCLMGNHVHLLLQVGSTSLSKIMHNLSFRYSQFINRRYEKVGHLFQGRFKAILIQEENYFLRLLRYIHMNPVRAYLVKNPENYPWSGHQAYLGLKECTWLTTHYSLSKFSYNLDEARTKYQDYVIQQESEKDLKELREGSSDGQILGNDTFLEQTRSIVYKCSSKPIPLPAIFKATLLVYKVNLETLASIERSAYLSLVRGAVAFYARSNGYSLEELAKTLKRDGSSLGR